MLFNEQRRFTACQKSYVTHPENIADAVPPQTVLHEATEAAVKTYNDSIEAAKQARDEAGSNLLRSSLNCL